VGFFSSDPATSTTTTNQTTTYTPDPATMAGYQENLGIAGGQYQNLINNYVYPGTMVEAPTDLTNQYWGQAGAVAGVPPDTSGAQHFLQNASGYMWNTQVDPSQYVLPQYDPTSFQPGALNLPQFGPTPGVSPAGGVSGLAANYLVNPQQIAAPSVQAQNVTAPGAITPISGLQQVQAPTLQQYQMGPAQNVSALPLDKLQMQAAGNIAPSAQVAPSGLATTQSWTDPGVAAQYMSPYTQQVVDAQLAQAKTQEQQQLAMQAAQAAQAGSFGGSRQGVEAANTSIGYQQLAAQLQAQGLQNAYQQGAQQFNTQQQLAQQAQQFNIGTGLGAQQFNVGTALQAAQANQQIQQQANLQNLSALLQTQGLQAQTGLQAALANQQAGLTVGGQNLAANLQTQGLGAQLGMQGQLANQQVGLQAALANQQALEFGAGQRLQAGLANQQAGLQAGIASAGMNMQGQLANQAAGIQTGLAAQQMGLQGGMFNAQQNIQAQLANQAAAMQALGMQYQGGLQGALQNQQLGLSGAEFGGQLGLSAAQQQALLRQQQQGLNMSALMQASNLQQGQAGLALNQYGAGLQGLTALQQAAMGQQGWAQQVRDAQYQNWLMAQYGPEQATSWMMQMRNMVPLPYSTQTQGTQTGVYYPAQQSILGQALQGAFGALGGFGKLFGGAKGGLVPTGLARIKRTPKPDKQGLGNFAAAA
jgi:hypothetical protein